MYSESSKRDTPRLVPLTFCKSSESLLQAVPLNCDGRGS